MPKDNLKKEKKPSKRSRASDGDKGVSILFLYLIYLTINIGGIVLIN